MCSQAKDNLIGFPSSSCESYQWVHGYALAGYMRRDGYMGYTGTWVRRVLREIYTRYFDVFVDDCTRDLQDRDSGNETNMSLVTRIYILSVTPRASIWPLYSILYRSQIEVRVLSIYTMMVYI